MSNHTPNSDEIPYGYCHCGCGQKAPIVTINNPARGHIKGQPYRFVALHHLRVKPVRPAAERFWEKVNKGNPGDCWEWEASRYTSGYGQFWDGVELVGAHRFAYQFAHGHIPNGMNVCHKCDNKICVNPAHLWLGSNQENMQDCKRKGRFFTGVSEKRRGEMNINAKLTRKHVIEIRELCAAGVTQVEIAKRFGISQSTVSEIHLRKKWSHLK